MENEEKNQPSAENPEKLSNLKFTKAKTWAAGVPAVMASLADVMEERVSIKGIGALFVMNQKGGFDCSSCAWPDPDDDRSPIAEYCENGAKALAEEATSKKVTAEFFAANSVVDIAKMSDFEIGRKGRLTEPVYLPKGGTHYVPIAWDMAFRKIASHLNSLDSADEAAFYTSGRTSNEASFIYQLFVREFGTNNMPDCSNMCHETTGVALLETLGLGKGNVRLDDFYESEVIVIIGQNPGTNAPRMMSALEKAKKNGAKIIAVNPLPEAGLMGFKNPQEISGVLGSGTHFADVFLQVKINGDMALFKAIELLLFEAEQNAPGKVLDQEFIAGRTVGYDEFAAHLQTFHLEELALASGVPLERIREAADILSQKQRIIFVWGMGLTQQRNGVDTLKEIVNMALLKGSIGKKGAGLCPVRGHSNVQGNRTMLISENPTQKQLDKLKEVFGFEPPREKGYDVVNAIKAMHAGRVKVFFGMGGNFLSASPDTNYTAEAMRKLKLSVHVSTKLNRSHLVHGEEALILPTLSRSDKDIVSGEAQFISCENSMGVVQSSKGILNPISDQLINETQIVCLMAKATLGNRSVVNWDKYANSYNEIRDVIAQCIMGFENYNEKVRKPGGFYLPNGPRDNLFITEEYKDKAPFTLTELPQNQLAKGEYAMATIRSHDQFNTTIYGMEDRYRGIKNERRVVFMNAQDMKEAGLAPGEKVDLFNYDDGVERVARLFLVVPYNIPKGDTATYYPETNVLIGINSVAEKSNTPVAKRVVIRIKKHAAAVA